MRVVIAGELSLADELLKLCTDAGHPTTLYLVESLADAKIAQQLESSAAIADVAIECHNESKAAKRRVVKLLEGAPLICVCALPCSTTEAASWTAQPESVVGWGAVPPLEQDGMMEVAPGLRTSPDALAAAQTFWLSIGLKPAVVADSTGLVRARIVCALVNEAATALMEGVASAADIDTAMKLGTNYPRGPLEWGDLIGLDVVLGVLRGLHEDFGEDRYRPCPLLVRHVQAGWLGRKTGQGFFEYSPSKSGSTSFNEPLVGQSQ
jgi:3-hydroxybutyryl-CoA dehydrogenase